MARSEQSPEVRVPVRDSPAPASFVFARQGSSSGDDAPDAAKSEHAVSRAQSAKLPPATTSEPPRAQDALRTAEEAAHAQRIAEARGEPLLSRSNNSNLSNAAVEAAARESSSSGQKQLRAQQSSGDQLPADDFFEEDGGDGQARRSFLRLQRFRWFRKRKLLTGMFVLGVLIFAAGVYFSVIDSRRKARSLMLVSWFLMMGLIAAALVTGIQKLAETVFVRAQSESVRDFCSTLLVYMGETDAVVGRAIWSLLTLVGVAIIVPENRNEKWRLTGYHLPRALAIVLLVEVARIITVLLRMRLAADFNTRTLRPKYVKSMDSEYVLCTLNRRTYNPLFLSLYTYLRSLGDEGSKATADLRVWQSLTLHVSGNQVDGSELSARSLKQRMTFGAAGTSAHSAYTRLFTKQLFNRLHDLCESNRRLRLGISAPAVDSPSVTDARGPRQGSRASLRARSQDDIQLRGGRPFPQGILSAGFWQGRGARTRQRTSEGEEGGAPLAEIAETSSRRSASTEDTIIGDAEPGTAGEAEAGWARAAEAGGANAHSEARVRPPSPRAPEDAARAPLRTAGMRLSRSDQDLAAMNAEAEQRNARTVSSVPDNVHESFLREQLRQPLPSTSNRSVLQRLARMGGGPSRSDSPHLPLQQQQQRSGSRHKSDSDAAERERRQRQASSSERHRQGSRTDRRRIFREDFLKVFAELTAPDAGEKEFDGEGAAKLADPEHVWATTFDQAQQGSVTATRFASIVLNMFDERRNIGVTLQDSRRVIKSIDRFVLSFLLVIVLFISMAMYEINFLEVWIALSSAILGFSFIFGESIKVAFENVIFLFVSHPYDVGDSINFPPEYSRWVVKRINLYTTELLRWDGMHTRVDNADLRKMAPLYNFNTSTGRCLQPGVEIDMECITPEFVTAVREDLRAHVKAHPDTFTGEVDFHARDMRGPFKMFCIFFAELVAPFGENIGKTMLDQSNYNTACAEIIKRHGGRYTRPYDRQHTAPYPPPVTPYALTPSLPDARGPKAPAPPSIGLAPARPGDGLLRRWNQARREDAAENDDNYD